MEGERVCPNCGYLLTSSGAPCPICGTASLGTAAQAGRWLRFAVGAILLLGLLSFFFYRQVQWTDKFRHYVEGLRALDAGDLEKAAEELGEADDYPGAQDLARSTSERVRLLQEAYRSGLQAAAANDWWKAARILNRAVSINPKFKEASELLEEARRRIGYMVVLKPYDPHVYVAHTDGLDLRQVPVPEKWFSPLAISAEGSTILASDATGSSFYWVDVATGRLQLVFSSPVPHQARLSPDGSAVVAFPCINTFFALHPGSLSVYRRDGTHRTLLQTGECTWAAFTPEGSHIVYSVNQTYSPDKGYRSLLRLYNLSTGDENLILQLDAWVVDMRFTAANRLLVVAYRGGEFSLDEVDLDAKTVRALIVLRRSFDGVLSPLGDVMVYRRITEAGPSNYFIRDLRTGREVYAFRCCGTVYQLPAFTLDGSRILYVSGVAPGDQTLYAVRPDGTDSEVVLDGVMQFVLSPPALSPE